MIEKVVTHARIVEQLLRDNGATGRGLHELTSSLTGVLTPSLVRRLRFIATVRNKAVHEGDVDHNTFHAFVDACGDAELALRDLLGHTSMSFRGVFLGVIALGCVAMLVMFFR
jgi:hypothetical protein